MAVRFTYSGGALPCVGFCACAYLENGIFVLFVALSLCYAGLAPHLI